jgi:hypothetical protein
VTTMGASQNAGRRRSRWFLTLLLPGVLLVGILFTACQALTRDPQEKALENATAEARRSATMLQSSLRDTLRRPDLPSDQALPTWLQEQYTTFDQYMLDGRSKPDGTVELVMAIDASGESSDGFSHKQTVVRLCVRYSGRPGPGADVTMAGATCDPAKIPARARKVDKVIQLTD